MTIQRRHVLMAGAAALAPGCALFSEPQRVGFTTPRQRGRLDLDPARLMRITVCTRPFRPAGPRLEAEAVDGKKIVHNYGHGGSGWSLSWGCADEAAALALKDGAPGTDAQAVAVVGAGVIGMTTALRLIEAGAAVTIYADAFPAETRSARATGTWSPSSRIALSDAVAPGFEDRWERWARASHDVHQHYVGLVGDPVEYVDGYALFDEQRRSAPPASRAYAHLDRRLNDIRPRWSTIENDAHPFQAARARGGLNMTFNVARYADRLTRDFLLRGGRMVRRSFASRGDMLALGENVIVNCTGYGARALWDDRSLAPVRGQINWLAPQSDARYSLYYDQVFALSRRDGVIVQYVGPNEDWGYGDATETADRDEFRMALERLAPVFGAERLTPR